MTIPYITWNGVFGRDHCHAKGSRQHSLFTRSRPRPAAAAAVSSFTRRKRNARSPSFSRSLFWDLVGRCSCSRGKWILSHCMVGLWYMHNNRSYRALHLILAQNWSRHSLTLKQKRRRGGRNTSSIQVQQLASGLLIHSAWHKRGSAPGAAARPPLSSRPPRRNAACHDDWRLFHSLELKAQTRLGCTVHRR